MLSHRSKVSTGNLFYLFLLLGLLACKSKSEAPVSTLDQAGSRYIAAFTNGVIGKTEPVRVQFIDPAVTQNTLGDVPPASLLSFSPQVAGALSWEDVYTLRFTPEKGFQPGTTYTVTVDLSQVREELPADAREFRFQFQTKEQQLAVAIEDISYPDQQRLAGPVLTGTVFTHDLADPAAVRKVITAEQNGRTLDVDWTPGDDQQRFDFTIKGVQRGEQPSAVRIEWNGDAIAATGPGHQGEKTVQIPALGDFKVLSVTSREAPDAHIAVVFSDPIDPAQNLDGFFRFADQSVSIRPLVRGNTVRLYPGGEVTGPAELIVSAGLKNTAGKALPLRTTWEVSLARALPELRTISSGTILPDGNQKMLFPFEAIGIHTIEVEIFKVYQNNLVQYFQQNSLAEAYSLQQVGRVVLRKRIPLNTLAPGASLNNWTRYALDLQPLIGADREAIYQVRIGFRPSDVSLACQEGAEYATANRIEVGFTEEFSLMDDYYGIEGYYPDFNYRDREDPCKPAYYNPDRFISSNVLVSNIGLIAKRAGDRKTTVIVTDLLTARPVSGARVELFDYQQQRMVTAETNAQGMVQVTTEQEPYLVVAHRGTDHNYLRLRGGEMLSLSRFPIDGVGATTGIKGYLYGERGVWRPGDSVYLNFLLEDREAHLPEDYPVVFTLRDARGQTREVRTARPTLGSLYQLYFATEPEAPTGNWQASVEIGGKTFSKTLRIETIKPNRIKVDLTPPAGGLRPGAQTLSVEADWLHGAPASGLKAQVEASFREDFRGFPDFAEFVFNDPARSLRTEPFVAFEGTLNDDGTAAFQLEAPQAEGAPGPLQLGIQTRVFEPGGDFSTDNQRLPFSPYTAYAGLQLPKNDWGESSLILDRDNSIRIVAVGSDGKPLANRPLNVGLYQVEWRWWWDDGYDNVSQYNSGTHHNAFKRATVETNARGEVDWSVRIAQWGRYLVRVCDTESGHCSGAYAYAGSPWSASEEMDRGQAAMLRLRTDRDQYTPGETAQVIFSSPVSGRALVSVESASAVLSTEWREVIAGENRLPVAVQAGMSPNVYANIQLFQPHAQTTNGLPIRLYGVVPVSVEVPERKLAPVLATAETWEPDGKVTVRVNEADGRAMNYTLAVVDEGLLSLTRFATPNAYDHFYAKEALGVDTWDVYDDVLGAFGGQVDRILAVGGDGENARDPDADRANRFEPVVRHLGPFRLAAGKTNTHTIELPNYIGAVRVMVVAESDRAYGSAGKTVPVRKPLMLLATLPRVLGPGEEMELPVNIFAMEPKIRNVRVSVSESSGLVSFPGEPVKRISFDRPGDALVRIPIRMKNAVGVARFEVLAEGNGESITQQIEIEVRNPNPRQYRVQEIALPPGTEQSLTYEHFGVTGTRSAVLEVSSLPPLNLEKRLQYLLNYPYGCAEQVVSSVFPQLYLDRFVELTETQRETRTYNLRTALQKIQRFQSAGGGIPYWPAGPENEWASSYTAHFLLEAKALGYAVPFNLLEQLLQFQASRARSWQPRTEYYATRDQSILDQAYRLYTLALAREPDLGAMNQLRSRSDLPLQAKWRLGAAYAQAGKPEVATALIAQSPTQVSDYRELSYTFGSALRDEAMILETLVAVADEAAASKQALYIARKFQDRSWLSTQEASFGLLALGKWLGEQPAGATLRINFTDPRGKQSAAGTDQAVLRIALPDQAGAQVVRVENTSQGPLFASVIVGGQPAVSEETAASRNLGIAIRYLDLAGNPLDIGELRQGTDFVAEATLSRPGNRNDYYRELALRQVFPSGWEVSNERMTQVGQTQESSYSYRDYRDDRVHTFFSLGQKENRVYRVRLTATYAGKFYLPAQVAEAMYDNDIYAATTGRWVTIIPID